ncbi:ATP-dependent RNA helicase DeaD [[Clostridium] fimetarium]|uniref:ATP-dependent RNA helicase CshA n=2 Tax=[Clostridium] fimetarium TaxID=99656 RepID=A0A1I0R4B2_9FIRM|nr:DEAD/DEAH box helicase [[Clostridium] fimetarium]SEW35114.1 ATP-dependent RNA helicase DeaD [[Clostridium] fimetarium]
MKFEELNIDEKILKAIEDMGFEEASPIQSQAIPVIVSGKDIVGQAQTGTGKTAAYAIPMLEKIDPKSKNVQAVVLCPTRELAIQVAEEIRKLAKYMTAIKVLPIYGGQEIVKQIKSLKTGVQVIVGTPGRVMDHMRRKTIKFDHVNMIILDEADEMLNMGFREDIETILTDTPDDRQTVLFSATMPKAIIDIAKRFQHDAETIKVVRKELTVTNIEQFYFEVRPKTKNEVLSRLIDLYNPKLSVVFCNTKRQVDELISELKGRGYFADGIHGDMKQAQRDRVMSDFRKGKTEILIATDVAARGIDVENVDIVFNYDLPQDEEYYVHRIGRTGRAGKAGMAFSFISGKEVYKLKDIERYCNTKIHAKPIPSLNDVKNTKLDKMFASIKETITEGNLAEMITAVEEHVNDEDYTAMDMAAALLKLSMGDSNNSPEDLQPAHYEEKEDNSSNTMVRLFINIGKKQGVKPSNILGAIAGESGIPGKLVGGIDMYDSYTFVEVPRKHANEVLAAMENVKIKGKSINIERASSNRKGSGNGNGNKER